MNKDICNTIAFFVNRDIYEHAYISLFRSGESNTSIIQKEPVKKICSKQRDFNFFEIMPWVFKDLLINGKAILFFEKEITTSGDIAIAFYYPREKIIIDKNNILSNDKIVKDKYRYNFVQINANKLIRKLKYKRIVSKLSKISCLPDDALSNINSNIPVDFKNYESEKNIYALKSTNNLGGLLGRSSNDLQVTGFYSYVREIRKKRIQYELFKNLIDEINQHFQKYKKELEFDISLKIYSSIIEKFNNIEEKMKLHEIDLVSVGDLLYKF